MIRLRTAAIGALLLSLMLNACSSGAGGMLPTAQNPGGMQSLSGGTAPQSTGRLPISVNCPSITLPPSTTSVGIHSQPTQRLSGAPASELVGATTLPTRLGCGNGIARPKRTMAWSGCSDGAGGNYGCNTHTQPIDDGGFVWSGGCWNVTNGGYSILSGPDCGGQYIWESGCELLGLPNGCNVAGGSGYLQGGPPCQAAAPCVAVNVSSAPQGGQCDGSPGYFGVGNDNLPVRNTDPTGTTIVNIFAIKTPSGVPMAWVYLTANEHLFFQSNGDSGLTGTLLSLLAGIPVVQGIAKDLVNATSTPYQITGPQWQNIEYGVQHGSNVLQKCWLKNYTQQNG